jgi:hypothetical protein
MAGMIVHLNRHYEAHSRDVEIPGFYVPPDVVLYDGATFVRQTPESNHDATYIEATVAQATDPGIKP